MDFSIHAASIGAGPPSLREVLLTLWPFSGFRKAEAGDYTWSDSVSFRRGLLNALAEAGPDSLLKGGVPARAGIGI
jgi:hypothetical protein